MKMKTLLAALAITVAPTLAFAECGWGKAHETAMSCAEGSTWDADSRSCVPVASSGGDATRPGTGGIPCRPFHAGGPLPGAAAARGP